MMTPLPGDTLINRYELVELLRREPGLEAWRATDHALVRDCQLFIVTDPHAAVVSNTMASALALSKNPRFTPVLQMHTVDDVMVLITALDDGISLSDYLHGPASGTLSFEAMRVIVGESALALQDLLHQGLADRAVSTDVIRLNRKSITIADAPVSPALTTPLLHGSATADAASRSYDDTDEPLAVRQLAGVLYGMLTRTSYADDREFSEQRLIDVADKPHDFWVICQRGLGFPNPDGSPATPISTLDELIALLGYWKPIDQLTGADIVWPSVPGDASIIRAQVAPVVPDALLELPDNVVKHRPDPNAAAKNQPDWGANLLLFPEPTEVELVRPTSSAGDDLLAPLHDDFVVPKHMTNATVPVDVSAVRHSNAGSPSLPHFTASPDATDSAQFLDPADTHALGNPSDILAAGAHGVQHAQDGVEGLAGREGAHTAASVAAATAARAEAAAGAAAGAAAKAAEIGTGAGAGTLGDVSAQAAAEAGSKASPSLERLVSAVENRQEEEAEARGMLHVDSAPPSFIPGERAANGPRGAVDDADGGYGGYNAQPNALDAADDVVFGRFTTRSVVIAVGAVLLVVALVLAMVNLFGKSAIGIGSSSTPGAWPSATNVPFPGRETPTATTTSATETAASGSASASASDTASASGSASASVTDAVDHSDRDVEAVPTPAPKPTPTNTTAYPITERGFLSRPNGLDGYGWYIKLDAPHDVWKVEIKLKQNNGHGSVYVNSNRSNPQNGASMGEWSVDASGQATVEFAQPVNTQEIVIWVPSDGLPTGGRITFNGVNAY
ncbi:virulence factor MVIN family protein [Bifidobacterium sp. DSM 109958]|uniref:Virulence factor MVIN family protein n=1 Tax=Bifidobacterium moraviense TaxID=2675323 RepID=A0A7Y0F2U9_9BIFI|nr:hypothetical protein [Bifidobacterium sp. DSM 109958]NMN01020.1 virulence factor MVIN family protein [Bifidobacterium sp. DSM 109958]